MGQLASDNFTRANAGTLGANWTDYSGETGWSINTNQALVATAGGVSISRYSATSMGGTDHYCQHTIGTTIETAADNGAGPAICMNGTDLVFMQANSTDLRVVQRVSGTYTQLGSTDTGCSVGQTLYIERSGNTIIAKRNGSHVCGSPISTGGGLPSGTYAGMWCSWSAANSSATTWSAGTQSASIDVTRAAIVVNGRTIEMTVPPYPPIGVAADFSQFPKNPIRNAAQGYQ